MVAADPRLRLTLTHPGTIDGVPSPALGHLLGQAEVWYQAAGTPEARVVVHGDPHLANVLVRRRGAGHSVRLFDPNPTVGCTDPLYDGGKLLHFTTELGLARRWPNSVGATFEDTGSTWTLRRWSDAEAIPKAVLRRMSTFDGEIRATLLRPPYDRPAALALAEAAAHVGAAALARAPEQAPGRNLALALVGEALVRWQRLADTGRR